jgi:hypothetical protein
LTKLISNVGLCEARLIGQDEAKDEEENGDGGASPGKDEVKRSAFHGIPLNSFGCAGIGADGAEGRRSAVVSVLWRHPFLLFPLVFLAQVDLRSSFDSCMARS